jgi:hypothetical protein
MNFLALFALRSFTGPEGRVLKGQTFTTTTSRANYLVEQKLAKAVPANYKGTLGSRTETKQVVPVSETATITPYATPTPEPTESLHDAPTETQAYQHVGGGWYEFKGIRYRGKKALEDAMGE